MYRMFSRFTAMKTGFYAVRCGRKPGVYSSWSECEDQVKAFKGARYKKFATENEAWNFVNEKDVVKSSSVRIVPVPTASTSSESQHVSNPTIKKHASGQKRSAILLPDDFHTCSAAKMSKPGYASVYTDGCCLNNGKGHPCAGVGVYWGPGHPNNLSERLPGRQTNNRAEIFAVIRAIQQAKSDGITELQIFTDSQFLINCQTKWVKKWKSNGWKSSTGDDVKNREELELLDAVSSEFKVTYVHVNGHCGIEGNEAADRLANLGAAKDLPQETQSDDGK